MNIYKLLRLNRFIKNERLKNLGIFLLHITGRRYFGLFLDPVLACNLRCRMCYYSDEEKRKTKKGAPLTAEQLQKIADAFFHRALKLQIGCGAEPSLYSHNEAIIRLAKEKEIPYISMTTNALLVKKERWERFLEAGLDEVTLSMHGVKRETYEYFMTNASYDAFLSSLGDLASLKEKYPSFTIRVNYTVNKDNLDELALFFELFGSYPIDILQIRPIQNLGDTAYHDFSWDEIVERYDEIIGTIRAEARNREITLIAPAREDLTRVENRSSKVVESTYFYISPHYFWQDDFRLDSDNYESYSRRTRLTKKLWNNIFHPFEDNPESKRNLNYEIG